jgi:hypothetical protein
MQRTLIALVLSVLVAPAALACGGTPTDRPAVPPLAAALELALPNARLPAAELATARQLLASIKELAAAGDEQAARRLEQEAMELLGFEKALLRCGPSSFMWVRRARAS